MPALATQLNSRSEEFKSNAAAMRLLVDDLNAKLARIAQGGGEDARAKHLSRGKLLRQVVIPAVLPEIVVGMRIGLGVAWLVVVAAEMIAVNSGLGFLIVDARNAGNRYDLVIAGMVMIGVIGLLLDHGMRRLERIEMIRRGYTA